MAARLITNPLPYVNPRRQQLRLNVGLACSLGYDPSDGFIRIAAGLSDLAGARGCG
jgi:hypothetical protein